MTVTLKKVYEELVTLRREVARRADVEALADTIAIQANKETMRQLAGSKRDKKAGRVVKVRSVRDLLG